LALALGALALVPAVALGAPPIVSATSLSEVTETTAIFTAEINPNNREVKDAHFQYIAQAAWESDGESFGEGTQVTAAQTIPSGITPVAIQAGVEGLAPGVAYRLRVFARNSSGTVEGPEEVLFAALASPPVFGPCPNDALRGGAYSPPAHPSAALPDCRAYEQATPVQKDGGDAVGTSRGFIHAAAGGDAIVFQSYFGIPGGEGAQELPSYLATRGPGAAGWSDYGLLPPENAGQTALLLGWTPEFSQSLTEAVRREPQPAEALFLRSGSQVPLRITPYFPIGSSHLRYLGASADGAEFLFASEAALPPTEGQPPIPAAHPGLPNLYLYDIQSERISLVSQMNTLAQSQALLGKGAQAGAESNSYLQEMHAIAADGSLYFTSISTGQLYRRLHPAMPQGPTDAEGSCLDPADPTHACTVWVSATEKDNGLGVDGADSAGPQAAVFEAASEDGRQAFFTSSEKLTNDANTGPEQSPAQIGRARLNGAGAADELEEGAVATHALGLAVSPDGQYVYWAEPGKGTIGRAKLNGAGKPTAPEPEFIKPGQVELDVEVEYQGGVIETEHLIGPSKPRYVAVDGEHVYWTNTGPLGRFGPSRETEKIADGAGTIGRATINQVTGEAEEVKPAFITGASNPQGIAVNAQRIYWANAGDHRAAEAIARANLEGEEVQQSFFEPTPTIPLGVALNSDHVYFSYKEGSTNGFVGRIPLEGGEGGEWESLFIGNEDPLLRGVAVDSEHVYWAAQGEGAIGRANLALEAGSREKEFLKPQGKLEGLASGEGRLYWSVNGEAPTNPGKDLYRYSAQADSQGHHLSDLTADAGDANGAEVVGVLGASGDGSRLYFLANGDLDGAGPAEVGNCRGSFNNSSGACSLYLWHEGTVGFVARLAPGSDATDWVPSPNNLFGSFSYKPKSSWLGNDGRALAFRSTRRLTAYDNHGVQEYYLFREGEAIVCLTCNPTGLAAAQGPTQQSILFPSIGPGRGPAPLLTRNLSASGRRFFFETAEGLTGADTDGRGGCPSFGASASSVPACQDVYEWEAAGEGSCEATSPSYSLQDRGCLYLLSPGDDSTPSFFADADEEGENVFIFSRDPLVRQDADSLQDVYDARVEGGLTAQNQPPSTPCEGDACRPALTPAPSPASPATPTFQGPPNSHPHRPKRHRTRHHHRKRHSRAGRR